MKIHIKKDKNESKGLFGGGKTWFTVHAHYELSEEEKKLYNENKNLPKMIAFDFPFRSSDGKIREDNFPIIKNMVDENDFRKHGGCIIGCVFSNGELAELEELINQGAKNLKAELYGSGLGSSTTEI